MSMPDVETEFHKDYRIVFANQVTGGLRNNYIEFDLVSQVSNFEPALQTPQPNYGKNVLKRILQTKVIMPPMDFKACVMFLQQTLEKYEKTFGSIASPEEIESKSKKDDMQ